MRGHGSRDGWEGSRRQQQGTGAAAGALETLLQWGKLYPAAGSVRSTFNIMSPITGLIFVGASTSAVRCYLGVVVQVKMQQRAEHNTCYNGWEVSTLSNTNKDTYDHGRDEIFPACCPYPPICFRSLMMMMMLMSKS